ncbi:MAG: hypothetical protein Q4C06_05975 [Bacillota bacterium]|nr:hypothetical protein [Bacillota bacterium]
MYSRKEIPLPFQGKPKKAEPLPPLPVEATKRTENTERTEAAPLSAPLAALFLLELFTKKG